MAKTRFLTNDALTRKRWAKDLFASVVPAVEYNDLVGTSPDSIVQLRTELGKGEGDQIKFGIRLPLTGEGIVGDKTVEGNEEKLRFKDFYMTIEELNHAVDTGGKMDEQRVPYDLMQEGKDGLQEWWTEVLSNLIINTLAGNSAYRIAGEVFAQAITEPDADHFLKVNDKAESAIGAGDTIDLNFLDRMKQVAENPLSSLSKKVRPLTLNGKPYFRVYLHNYVFDALRQNVNVGQWGDLLRAAGKLAQPNVEIEYNGMLISKTERLPSIYSNVYRSILVGKQAACWAWGGAGESKGSVMSFVPYEKDAKRFVMIRGGGIFGVKKTVFDSRDYGVVTGASFGTRLS